MAVAGSKSPGNPLPPDSGHSLQPTHVLVQFIMVDGRRSVKVSGKSQHSFQPKHNLVPFSAFLLTYHLFLCFLFSFLIFLEFLYRLCLFLIWMIINIFRAFFTVLTVNYVRVHGTCIKITYHDK